MEQGIKDVKHLGLKLMFGLVMGTVACMINVQAESHHSKINVTLSYGSYFL